MNPHTQEYIGRELEVVKSKNKSLLDVNGRVIDETKHTFVVETKERPKRILKQGNLFRINGEIIEGDRITKRPEERLKIRRKG